MCVCVCVFAATICPILHSQIENFAFTQYAHTVLKVYNVLVSRFQIVTSQQAFELLFLYACLYQSCFYNFINFPMGPRTQPERLPSIQLFTPSSKHNAVLYGDKMHGIIYEKAFSSKKICYFYDLLNIEPIWQFNEFLLSDTFY